MRIYITREERNYLKSLLEAQDEPEFEDYKKAAESLLKKMQEVHPQ